MSKFDEVASVIDKVISDYNDLAKQIQLSVQSKIKEILAAFFDSYPEVKTVHWTQYAPHFNDGDECVFSVNEPYFTKTKHGKLAKMSREVTYGEGDDGIIELSLWDSEKRDYVDCDVSQDLKDAMDKLARILQSDAVEPAMRAAFGESVWVLAHRGGFKIDDYYHD